MKQGLKQAFRELGLKLDLHMEAELDGVSIYVWSLPILEELTKRVKRLEIEVKWLKKGGGNKC